MFAFIVPSFNKTPPISFAGADSILPTFITSALIVETVNDGIISSSNSARLLWTISAFNVEHPIFEECICRYFSSNVKTRYEFEFVATTKPSITKNKFLGKTKNIDFIEIKGTRTITFEEKIRYFMCFCLPLV